MEGAMRRMRFANADTLVTNERLLEIIVKTFQYGEFNRPWLANTRPPNSRVSA
jgi:hypothetical protein